MNFKLIPWAYLLLALLSIRRYLLYNPLGSSGTLLAIENILVFYISCFYPYYSLKLYKSIAKETEYKSLNCFIIYTLLLCIYSLVVNYPLGNKYEKMDLIVSYLGTMSCISVYYLTIPNNFTCAVHGLYKYLPILAIIVFPFVNAQWVGDMLGFMLMPIILSLLFWSRLSRRKKILYVVLVIYVILTSYWGDARSHVIKYSIAFLMGFLLIRFPHLIRYFKQLIWGIIAVPFVLFILATTGVFNIFQYGENLDNSNLQENTLADTRTFLYTEAISSAIDNDYYIFGRGIGRGYKSYLAEVRFESNDKAVKGLFSDERNAEVAVVNTITWGGGVYLLINLIMVISIVYYGCYHTKNIYVNIVAFFYSFHWVYCWVENFQGISISYFSSWFFVAICLSKRFRELSNEEFEIFIKKTF